MLSRVLEEAGLATAGVSLIRLHTEKVRPPRALWVPFPLGRPLGKPNDPAFQHRVLAALLALFDRPSGPVLEDYPEDAPEADGEAPMLACPLEYGYATEEENLAAMVGEEIALLRDRYERTVGLRGRTTVGLTKATPGTIGGLAQLLADYAVGRPVELPEPPPGTRPEQFLRYAVEDLKSYYFEAAADEAGIAPSRSRLNDWYYRETGAGRLVRKVRDRLDASGDPELKYLGFGMIPVDY